MKTFANELGNQISVEVVKKMIDGVNGILICIEGPTSRTEVHVTQLEARVLLERLAHSLDSSNV